MNRIYLEWQISRAMRQPATLFLAGIYIAILACVGFFVSIDMSGERITGVRLGRILLDEPGFIMTIMLPSLANLVFFLSLFLFLLAASNSGAESLYHPMNDILFVTPLTRTQLYLTSCASTALVFSSAFAGLLLFFHLIVGIKSGLYAFAPAAASIAWTALLYASCSALTFALLPLFKKSTTVLVLLVAILILASQLTGMHQWYFRILATMLPPLTNYQAAAVNALFYTQDVGNLLLPAVTSIVYLSGGMFLYTRQDMK